MANTIEIKVPDIGGATDVDVIEILVKKGEKIAKEQSIITLEGDKATMEIPSPAEGEVESIQVKVGDKVSQGSLILLLKAMSDQAEKPKQEDKISEAIVEVAPVEVETKKDERLVSDPLPASKSEASISLDIGSELAAGPAVRRLARELGVDLSLVKGSGRKDRILTEDIQNYVKSRLKQATSGSGIALAQAPVIDFTQFGTIETKPLNKIKRLTGQNTHRAWVSIPHVTQFDEADITDLEAFRKESAEEANKKGYKLTLLAFVCKVVYKALVEFPQFNASLDSTGENLIYKNYYNLGIAAETPNGLVVPVIKGVESMTVGQIAQEMGRLSAKAREKGLMPNEMNGGCFTISSLGGIGGTAFTPIVNSPEVAILGLSRSSIKPIYQNGQFVPRLMLPLSLSYDHRVIDGAEAARFTRFLTEALGDIRRILL